MSRRYKNSTIEKENLLVDLKGITPNQELLIESINKYPQVFAFGYAGTGKTYIPATMATNMYLTGKIRHIIVVRPNVGVGPKSGFLPGTLTEKYDPVFDPIASVFKKHLGLNKFENDVKNEKIQLKPLEYMRGSTLEDAFIILDEAQNVTVSEIKMFCTRLGENVKVVFNGDIKQKDIKEESGLSVAIRLAKKYKVASKIVEMGEEDIVRSELCKQWVLAFDAEGI